MCVYIYIYIHVYMYMSPILLLLLLLVSKTVGARWTPPSPPFPKDPSLSGDPKRV